MKTFVLLLTLLAAPLLARGQEQKPSAPAGDAAQALSLEDTSGRRQSLDDYRDKILVLNFWATWCVPCREEMPLLAALRGRYVARGVEVVAASADDESTRQQVEPFVRELKMDFPVWVGATTGDMQRFGLGAALPATAILDRDGRIAFRIKGPVTESELRERIEWLLGERKSASPAVSLNNIKPHAHDKERAQHEDKEAHSDKDGHADEEHGHEGEEEHDHGGVGMEGASTVPS